MGIAAGINRLAILPFPPFFGYVGLLPGVIIGLTSPRYRTVYQDAVGTALAGTAVYLFILIGGAQFGLYEFGGPSTDGGFQVVATIIEPVIFTPLFVVESLVAAGLVKTIRVAMRDEGGVEV